MFICRLPFEVVALVVGYLDLDEAHNLSMTCRHFRFIEFDQGMSKAVLEVIAAFARLA
jgi:hypothetical protein